MSILSLTPRGVRDMEYWMVNGGRPETYTSEYAVTLFVMLAWNTNKGKNVVLESIRNFSQLFFGGNDRVLRLTALYIRDHTQAVLAGALARGWITISHSPTL
jgi:hypothetical protein